MRVRLVAGLVATAVACSLAACTDSPADGPPSPEPGGTITLPIARDPENLNPYASQTAEAALITKAIYENLIDLSSDGEYVPVLAAELPSTSSNGTQVTWTLRDDVRWSDGTPFTSADVVFTADLLMRSLGDAGTGWDLVTDVAAADAHTVVISYSEYYPAYLDHFSGTSPDGGVQAIFSQRACDTGTVQPVSRLACADEPVGTGPFVLDSWQRGAVVTLARNPHHSTNPGPYLERIAFPVVPTAFVRTQMLQSDQAQALWNEDFQGAQPLREAGHSVVPTTPWVSRIHVNLDRPVLADLRVRAAISLALDRNLIVEEIFGGDSQPVTSELFRLTPPATRYDPAAAASELDAAGWRANGNGQPRTCATACPAGAEQEELRFSLLIKPESAGYSALSLYIQSQLESIGIGLEITAAANIDERVLRGDYDLALRDDGYVGDPGAYLLRCHGSTRTPSANGTWEGGWNVERYASEEFDAVILQAQAEPDRERRQSLLLAANAVLERDLPAIFLATFPYPSVYSSRLHGWEANINTPMTWDVHRWYLG